MITCAVKRDIIKSYEDRNNHVKRCHLSKVDTL